MSFYFDGNSGEPPSAAEFDQFGDVPIFRPSAETEAFVCRRARAHLLSRFAPSVYRGATEANKVIQHQFRFYEEMLKMVVPQLGSRGAVEFLLFQYDQAWCLIHGKGIVDLNERKRWEWLEPVFKRAIKYLLELICLNNFHLPARPSRNEALFAMETALVCAESMVHLAQESDTAYSVFPNECVVKVHGSGPLDFEIGVEGENHDFASELNERIARDRNLRDRFVKSPQFDYHTATHQNFLDEPFRRSFGMSYGEFIAVIRAVIEGCQPASHPNSFSTLFVHREGLIAELAKSHRSRKAIELAINGFSISPTMLKAENRVAWNPKQECRAYRRGFFLFPDETGTHVAFSRAMAKECLMQLVFWVCFKKLPSEWRTSETIKGLEDLSRAASDWFEDTVRHNLASLGLTGRRYRRAIGSGAQRIQIPREVGEIDFLGFDSNQKLLVIAEAKMTLPGLEARYWRDDLHEFVNRAGSYAERFRRKIAWVTDNRHSIAAALDTHPDWEIRSVMITLYPCVARTFISDFACVSITELMLDFERAGGWPYP